MQEAAAQTDFTIAVLSETYLKSEYTQPEWAAAFAQDPTGKKRKLIPVRVAACSLAGMLVPIVHIDLIGLGEPDAKRALLDGLKPSGKPAEPPRFPGKRAESAWTTGETSLILHDLQRDLIHKRREKELPGLHLRLVKAWDALPKLDSYAWRWVAYHLVEAGCKDDLRRLLFDFTYLEAKLATTDANALIADYDYLPEEKDLRLVQSAIRIGVGTK